MKTWPVRGGGVVQALLLATLLCLLFYGFRLWQAGTLTLSYLPWNLFLAWVPLGLTAAIIWYIKTNRWSNWPGLLLTVLWLLFLPNSFYLVSDYIHLRDVAESTALYDSVMFTMFVFTGMLLGYTSLYRIHVELRKRLTQQLAAGIVAGVLLLCSFAMYIGRDLRWNSWDVLASPSGLLFDVSNRFLNTGHYRDVFGTTALFFALLVGIYYVSCRLVFAAREIEPTANRPLV